MQSKYPGRCKACGGYFPQGADIEWLDGVGAFHADCYKKYAGLESGLQEVLILLLKNFFSYAN